MNKEYVAEIKLGETTPSYDLETEVNEHYDTAHITEQLIKETLKKYEGTYHQEPPVYSAKNINGKRAYEYARKGQPVKMKPKKITIYKLELQKCELPLIKVNILCSKGTYIRALARDIGKELKTGAHLISLRRTSIGNFNVLDVKNLQEF
jgi:tRNA pseudouridine55 synthase